MLRGTNQEFGRPYNRRIVLETIRLNAPITRADIARRVGLTVQTVSTIIRELELQGFLVARREEPKGRGSPAVSLAINPEGGFAVGVHMTPLGVEAALVNIAGEVVGRDRRGLPHADPEDAFAAIEALSRDLMALRPKGRMLGVGMAMPGPFDIEPMSFVGPTTLEGWKGVRVRERLSRATGLPAFIEVDSAAAADGERLYGAGRNFRDFYYLYFGVGLGGAMVHDGALLRGAWGNAGEIGHVPVVPGGDACACGNRGCLERYVSLEAYERRSREIGEEGWLQEVAPLLRSAIVTIENFFDPETIILGGLASDDFLARLIAAAEPLPNSVASRRDRPAGRLMRSRGGQDSVLRGAAALAVAGNLSPRFGLMFKNDRAAADPLFAGEARAA